jgi:peptidoglycan hydrolase-like protein with peptidoglycan-binding domain
VPKRISNARRVRVDYEDDDFVRAPRRRSILRRAIGAMLPRRVSDTIALAIATAAALAVVVNAVAFQETPRSTLDSLLSQDAPNPQPRPNDAPARSVTDLIQNIQRELSVRGYYNGAVDGVPGPRTEQAIRDFQKGKTGQNTLEPSDELLKQIRRVPVKSEIRGDITGSINAPLEGDRKSLRVLSLQQALARLGYGPVRMSGTFGPDTKEAIERFEKDWMMPVTGLMSDNLFTKLAAVNGAPID